MIASESAKLIRAISFALCLLPILFLLWLVIGRAVDVPFGDSWEFIPVLQKAFDGQIPLHDLWAQHNEHRVLVSGAILVALAKATHWNTLWEVALTVILGVAIFGVLTWQLNRTARSLQVPRLWLVLPGTAIAVFSAAQYENWLWGWQFSLLLSVFSGVCNLLLLTNGESSWKKVCGAGALSLIATYSFAYGLTLWPIGAVLLAVGGAGWRKLATWGAASSITLATYFFHYQKPVVHPPMTAFLHHPMAFVAYILKHLGGICAQLERYPSEKAGQLALVAGVFLLAGMGWVMWVILAKRIASFDTLLPYLAISVYSLGTAILSGIGRLGMGSDQALFSRYCTVIAPMWVSFLICLMMVVQRGESKQRTPAFGCLLAAIFGLVFGSIKAVEPAKVMSRSMALGRKGLRDLVAHPLTADVTPLNLIYSDPNVVMEELPFLKHHELSLFRENAPASY